MCSQRFIFYEVACYLAVMLGVVLVRRPASVASTS